jgi:hypothetical protein
VLFRPKNNLYYITAQAQWGSNAPDASRKGLFQRIDHTWTTPTPWIASSWVEHGPVDLTPHPGAGDGDQITAGVSLLLRDDVQGSPHYAFITTSNSAAALYVAESTVRHNMLLGRVILCCERHKCAGFTSLVQSTRVDQRATRMLRRAWTERCIAGGTPEQRQLPLPCVH